MNNTFKISPRSSYVTIGSSKICRMCPSASPEILRVGIERLIDYSYVCHASNTTWGNARPYEYNIRRKRNGLNRNDRSRRFKIRSQSREDLYTTLGVKSNADSKELKRAYRQLALKYHPDVNKEAGAESKFMAIKQAYSTLADPQSRAEYDRRRAWGGGAWTGGDPGWDARRSSRSKTDRYYDDDDEPFYGLEDFFRDLDKDWSAKKSDGKVKSLWEELNDIGEEFVDFLEGVLDDNFTNVGETDWASMFEDEERRTPNDRTTYDQPRAQKASPPPPPDPKKEEQAIEDMLSALKKQMGL